MQNNHKEVVKECLKRGARINLQNKKVQPRATFHNTKFQITDVAQGQTALHFACAYGYTELAKYLISKGARLNQASTFAQPRDFFQPRRASCVHARLPGCDPNIKNENGKTCFEGLSDTVSAVMTHERWLRQMRRRRIYSSSVPVCNDSPHTTVPSPSQRCKPCH
jgi:ankyrin repeat protein